MSNAAFLPRGGYIGFGLSHLYPVSEGYHPHELKGFLKGSDAVLMRVCDELSLGVEIKVAYKDQWDFPSAVLCDSVLSSSHVLYDGMASLRSYLLDLGGKLLVNKSADGDSGEAERSG